MTQQFPPKPWNVDDTFVNIETGVEYVFNGDQWIAGGSQYEAGYTERGNFEYRRSGDAFGAGVFQNIVDSGSQPHDSLTRIKLHKTSQDGNTAPSNYYQPGQLLRIKNGANAAFYRIATVDADNANFYLVDVTYEGLQGNKFDFYLRDVLGIECRELAADPLDTYLPLTGGELTGDLNVNNVLRVEGDEAFYDRNRIGISQLGARELVNGGILSNLMLSPNDGYLKDYLPLTGGALTGALSVANGNQVALTIKNGNSDKIKFWGSGAVQLSGGYTAFKDDELVTKAYVDNTVGDINLDYLPLTGGELTGALTIRKNTQVALEIIGDSNTSQIKFWSSGAIALQNYTGFKDNELVTKKYVDDKVAAGGSGFTPGDKVAAASSASAVQGGFYIQNGNLYCKIT